MSADPPGDEVEGEALADLLGAVEEMRVVESVSDAQETPLDRGNPVQGNVSFWVRNLDRKAADEPPFAMIQFRPYGRSTPTIRLHGYLSAPEPAAGWKFLGVVERASRDKLVS